MTVDEIAAMLQKHFDAGYNRRERGDTEDELMWPAIAAWVHIDDGPAWYKADLERLYLELGMLVDGIQGARGEIDQMIADAPDDREEDRR